MILQNGNNNYHGNNKFIIIYILIKINYMYLKEIKDLIFMNYNKTKN